MTGEASTQKDFLWGRRPLQLNLEAVPFELEHGRAFGMTQSALGVLIVVGAAYPALVDAGAGPGTFLYALALAPVAAWFIVFGVWRLVRPDVLRVSESGFEYRRPWRATRWDWRLVNDFQAGTAWSLTWSLMGRSSRGQDVIRFSVIDAPGRFSQAAIEGRWSDIKPEALANFLNAARRRYAPDAAAGTARGVDRTDAPSAPPLVR